MPLLEVVASSPAIVTVLPVALVSIPSPPVIVNVSPRVFVALPLSEDRVMSLAVTAPLDTVKFVELKLAIPLLKKNKSGSIVNLSSVSWILGEGDKVVYETAKSAVIGLSRSFAQEFGKYNIRSNVVTPGSIATERQIKNWLTPKYKKFILNQQALKRQLKPNDVANLVLYLSSDVSSGCTKQNFIVDAGIT